MLTDLFCKELADQRLLFAINACPKKGCDPTSKGSIPQDERSVGAHAA
jgi:hypothetical protein